MNFKLVIFFTACLTCLVVPVAGTSLCAVKGTIIGAGLSGAALSSSSGSKTLCIQAKPGTIAVEAVPAQQVVVQQPVEEYMPVPHITLTPVGTVSSSYSIKNMLSSLWGGISSAINTKTRAVGNILRSLRGPPRLVLINVDRTKTTTTTTKKPATMTMHNPHHIMCNIVAVPEQEYHSHKPPVAELVTDCNRKW